MPTDNCESNQTPHQMYSLLDNSGFYRVRDGYQNLVTLAKTLNSNAGSDQLPRFEAFPSYLAMDPDSCSRVKGASNDGLQLIVDIGGTSTKVGAYCTRTEQWFLLFDTKNHEFKDSNCHKDLFVEYATSLGSKIKQALIDRKLSDRTCSQLGIVWSNAMVNLPIDSPLGVSGKVVQREQYRKGEWFVEELNDEDDIAQPLLAGFKKADLNFEVVVIGNDTCLTMKAIPGAAAGMVASTGLNATIVKTAVELGLYDSDTKVICNAEMGGRFYLPDEYLGDFDWVSKQERASTVELLTAGKFLPLLFTSYIKSLGQNGLTELRGLSAELMNSDDDGLSEFRTKDLSLLFSDRELFISRRSNKAAYTETVLNLLEMLSRELFVRSAELCSLVAYGSTANQLDNGIECIVALDSRLSREVPLFWEHFNSSLAKLFESKGKISLELVEPLQLADGKISVPMIGLSQALSEFH